MSKKRTEYSESFKAEAVGKIKENAGNELSIHFPGRLDKVINL